MWELFTGERPWRGMAIGIILNEVLVRGQRPALPAWLPPAVAALVGECWAQDPKQRPAMEQVLRRLEEAAAAAALLGPGSPLAPAPAAPAPVAAQEG